MKLHFNINISFALITYPTNWSRYSNFFFPRNFCWKFLSFFGFFFSFFAIAIAFLYAFQYFNLLPIFASSIHKLPFDKLDGFFCSLSIHLGFVSVVTLIFNSLSSDFEHFDTFIWRIFIIWIYTLHNFIDLLPSIHSLWWSFGLFQLIFLGILTFYVTVIKRY